MKELLAYLYYFIIAIAYFCYFFQFFINWKWIFVALRSRAAISYFSNGVYRRPSGVHLGYIAGVYNFPYEMEKIFEKAIEIKPETGQRVYSSRGVVSPNERK
jgi:hypothetical protein